MTRILFSLIFLLNGLVSLAQQFHFVYLQTDNKQPFYVKLNEKLYSSSASGYVVIPKLTEGAHTFSIGFPKNEWPTQNISVQVTNKDIGFIIKNFDSIGWGLFNLQTLQVIMNSTESSKATTPSPAFKTDDFSNTLADVVNTPSIKEEKKVIPIEPVSVPVQVKEPVQTINTPELKKETASIIPMIEKSSVEKLSINTNKEGVQMLFVDKKPGSVDTIRISIDLENDNTKVQTSLNPVSVPVKKEEVIENKQVVTTADSKLSPKFIEIELPNPNSENTQKQVVTAPQNTNDAISVPEVSKTSDKPGMINSDCKQIAVEEDFLKTRKKMTAEKNDDGMIVAAKKQFKQKCYSTEQIKNLSLLFLGEEGKYKFFDAAYPYVNDSQKFKELESQLTDKYLISRFRAMIRN